jgi:hypothetical protein
MTLLACFKEQNMDFEWAKELNKRVKMIIVFIEKD